MVTKATARVSTVYFQCTSRRQLRSYRPSVQDRSIEIGEATPFTAIGNMGYGQSILNRTLTYESSLRFAVQTGFLSFDSTRVSANDVGYPIDIVVYKAGTYRFMEQRFTHDELRHIATGWAEILKTGLNSLNDDWMDGLLSL